MKKIIALIKWAWCYCSGEREYFEKQGGRWICTRCGREE